MAQFAECPCTGKTLIKLLRPAILAILGDCPLHGYVVVRKLEQMPMFPGPSPDTAGVYRVLKGMEKEGLLVSSWDTTHNGPAKRIFTITADGKACLRQWHRTLKQYHKDVETLLNLVTQTIRRGKHR